MFRVFLPIAASALLVSCSSLPVPGVSKTPPTEGARNILKQSALRHGDPWNNHREVKVAYDGEWAPLAAKLQPVLTDSGFRRTSEEIYRTDSGKVLQVHRGPKGTKIVERQRPAIQVRFNGTTSMDREVLDAAALVADAYTAFLFGPSWLVRKGTDFRAIGERNLDGEPCHLIGGRLSPGFGTSGEDYFIAWIGQNSGLMKRFQFTINGLETTQGADVDVTFSQHRTSASGAVWPGHFVEHIQRPISARAHQWNMTSLTVDGRKAR